MGGSLLAAVTVTVGGAALPSLAGYRILFVICAVAATLAAFAGLIMSSDKLTNTDRASGTEVTPLERVG